MACEMPGRSVPRDSIGLAPHDGSASDPLVLLSRSAPGGFSSMEYDSTGGLTLRLVDTSHVTAVRAALLGAYAPGRSSDWQERFARDLAGARVAVARWSLADLTDWFHYLQRRMFAAAPAAGMSVVGAGLNPRREVISFVLPSAQARVWAERVLADLHLPCGLVETTVGGPSQVL